MYFGYHRTQTLVLRHTSITSTKPHQIGQQRCPTSKDRASHIPIPCSMFLFDDCSESLSIPYRASHILQSRFIDGNKIRFISNRLPSEHEIKGDGERAIIDSDLLILCL